MLRYRGAEAFRLRLALACISGKPVRIDEIRAEDESPGLKPYEASLLRLLEKVSNGCVVEINETGTSLRFRPGIIIGGDIKHDCNVERGIAYYLEPLLVLCLFAKKPLAATLRGATNATQDVSVDAFRTTALPLLRATGATVSIAMPQRAVGPATGRGGVVTAELSPLRAIAAPLRAVAEGLVRRIRGVAWTVNLGPQYATAAFSAAKGVLLRLLADVQIFTDVVALRAEPGGTKASAGYGVVLVAETTEGRFLAAEATMAGATLLNARAGQQTAADVGEEVACRLLDEVARGGVVDGARQALALTLAAFGPPELNRVRIGALCPQAVQALRLLRDFVGVTFDVRPDAAAGTVLFSCIGAGIANVGRRVD